MINIFGRNKKQADISLQEVKTLIESNIRGHDRNNDGIPDYLQRPELRSLISSNKDLNQWESDTVQEIENFVMGLRGYEYDPEKKAYIPVSPPTLNEIGIRKVRTHLQAIANKHGKSTSLKEEEAHKMCQYHTSSLISWFKYNSQICGVGHSELTPIITEFDVLSFLVLSASINDGQRGHVTQRTKLTGSANSGQPAIMG